MDDLVKQAMAKWPNVPHCYGWLGLDARGHWRMRDERTQQLGLPGDKIAHEALLAFIARNYTHDARGCWYFQNGPQRVYVTLATTPYVARTDAAQGYVLHTGAPLETIDTAWLTAEGELVLRYGDIIAQLDDRDGAQWLDALQLDGKVPDDTALQAWLDGGAGTLTLLHAGQHLPVQHLDGATLPALGGFVRTPAPAPEPAE